MGGGILLDDIHEINSVYNLFGPVKNAFGLTAKAGDLKIERGDIVLERDGSLKTVSENDKLRQDIVKILLTKLRENKYHPEYGSEVGLLKIGHVADQELLEIDLQAYAEGSIRKLMARQREQAKRQVLNPGEVIVNINDISISRDTVDPRLYNIFISILTQQLNIVSELIAVRII